MPPKAARKRPAASAEHVAVRKRPAAASDEDPAAEGEELLDEEQEASGVLKRPAAAAAEGDAGKTAGANVAQRARAASRAVEKQQRVLGKLGSELAALKSKTKANHDATKKAQQELERLQDEARRASAAASRVKSAKNKAKREMQARREAARNAKASRVIKATKKRMAKFRDSLSSARGRAEDASASYERAKRAFDDAKKRCKELSDSGEHVPAEGEKDLSAPGAWKPPGVQAAKARDAAKVAFAKAKAVWERATAAASVKEGRQKALKDKMQEVKSITSSGEGHAAKVAKRPSAK